jgi:hypothetical protein
MSCGRFGRMFDDKAQRREAAPVSTPSRLAGLGSGLPSGDPDGFPEFGRCSPDRFRPGGQIYQGSAPPLSYSSKPPEFHFIADPGRIPYQGRVRDVLTDCSDLRFKLAGCFVPGLFPRQIRDRRREMPDVHVSVP